MEDLDRQHRMAQEDKSGRQTTGIITAIVLLGLLGQCKSNYTEEQTKKSSTSVQSTIITNE